jgi:WS/DGAT/MGAT family acyltransferase
MKRLKILDVGFLAAERRNTPMHVGGLHLFELPKGERQQHFLRGLVDQLRATTVLQPPFGDKLKMGRLGVLGPVHWEADQALDLEYHVRHSALPAPGRYRELFALVSRLHGTLLDRSRPLWEMHVIEGVRGREFAVYYKFHHAAVDGVRALHLTQTMYSPDPNEHASFSPLSIEARDHYQSSLASAGIRARREHVPLTRAMVERVQSQLGVAGDLYTALRKQAALFTHRGDGLMAPWLGTPRSAINAPVDCGRRFVAQSWSIERIYRVAKAFDGTLNDAVLAMSGGALRRYLQQHAHLPDQSLSALVPVSLRRKGDVESSNAIGGVIADLATDEADPAARMLRVQRSMIAGKALYKDVSPEQAAMLFALMQTPMFLLSAMGMSDRFPPVSTVVSNVPGPRQPLHWNGARLKGIYPASIVLDGFALNITLVGYDQNLDFGIVAARRSAPQVQRLIDYLEEALVELEDAAGLGAPKPKVVRQRAAAKRAVRQKGAPKFSGAEAETSTKTKTKTKTVKKAKVKTATQAKTTAKAGTQATAKTRVQKTAAASKPRQKIPSRTDVKPKLSR